LGGIIKHKFQNVIQEKILLRCLPDRLDRLTNADHAEEPGKVADLSHNLLDELFILHEPCIKNRDQQTNLMVVDNV
jgi:hypothetical protein